MENKVRIGVVGLGFMGMTHLQAIEKQADAELAAVCSGDEKKLAGDLSGVTGNLGTEKAQFDFSGVAKFREPGDLFRSPDVDAVSLCVPTDLHCRMAVQALVAGKHVLVEKPMALTPTQCRTMRDAAREAGRVLMVGQVLRFWPEYVTAKQMVASGRLGAVTHAAFRRRCGVPSWGGWLFEPDRSGGGVFDLLVHDFDFAIYLLGNPLGVEARGSEDAARRLDVIAADVDFANVTARITGGWYPGAVPFSAEFQIVGTEGTLESDSRTGGVVFYPVGAEAQQLTLSGDAFSSEMGEFVRCCHSGSSSEICPPGQSALAVALSLAARDSRSTGERYERSPVLFENEGFERAGRRSRKVSHRE